jgi:small-conductance mechanosensitive channel
MDSSTFRTKTWSNFIVWSLVAGAVVCARRVLHVPPLLMLPGDMSIFRLVGIVAGVMALSHACSLLTLWRISSEKKPEAEAIMVSRLYGVLAFVAAALVLASGFGKLEAFGTFFSLFGGMLLGFSLQAPITGLAGWVLVSLKRPFRPGDRVQFPNLGLTGDIKDIGIMYTVLDQVGGTIGSEEAVGRNILMPNAMLFNQVAINYTARQEAGYMLDEVVVRITYDSNWEKAEEILTDAAIELTKDIIAITGMQPYIRSDMYDYGVNMRLRYQTPAKDRAEMSYKISKRIFEEIQRTPTVDLAIPFVYSARAGARELNERPPAPAAPAQNGVDPEAKNIQQIPLDRIKISHHPAETDVLDQLAQSIAAQGLLQPIVLIKDPGANFYEIAAGHLRFDACKRLGWKTIPAVVRGVVAESRLTKEAVYP